MQVPLEVAFRDVTKTEDLDTLIEKEAQKLEKVYNNITSCRLAVEKPHKSQQSGNPYRVRIDVRVPHGNEIVVTHEPNDSDMHEPLQAVLRSAFNAAHRQLRKLVEQQRGEVKRHPEQAMAAVVRKLFRDKEHGFLQTVEGEEVYFHKNSVLNDDFDRLHVGTGVRFVSEQGEKGLQATTVQIVNKPGSGIKEEGVSAGESPKGWEREEVTKSPENSDKK